MPIFEYKCSKCNHAFEKLIFTGDDKNISCPECKSLDINKKISATNLMGKNSSSNCSPGRASSGFS